MTVTVIAGDKVDDMRRRNALSLPLSSKCKGLDTCYSTAFMSLTRDQQRFTISEVAADWHEPVVLECMMWLSIARTNG